MNKKIGTLSSIAALLLGGSSMVVHSAALDGTIGIPEGNSSYTKSLGDAIKTGLGDCLKTGTYSDDAMVNACEGIEDAPVEAAVEPTPEPAPAPEPAPKEPIVTTATLGGEALFDTNSAELNASSEQALAELVSQLEKFQEISAIEVVGHTDSSGEASYNQMLSEKRAESVSSFLTAAYPNVQISAAGMGEDSPIATNSTKEGRAMNRRVEVQVTAKSITE